jgi:hypothetical protein
METARNINDVSEKELMKPIFLKVKDHLKSRLIHQCQRLGISQAAAISQSLVKWLEEEEKIEFGSQKRR